MSLTAAATHASDQPTTLAAYTDRDIAAMLQISLRTVHRLAAAGKIPGRIQIGRSTRYRRSAIDAWIESGCKAARGR